MNNNIFYKRLMWSKTIPVVANVLSAILFFTAYLMKPVIWFLIAAIINIFVAVAMIFIFNKFEKKYSGLINKSENNKGN
jgi:biopolymer transport protein ExbB/TolQ